MEARTLGVCQIMIPLQAASDQEDLFCQIGGARRPAKYCIMGDLTGLSTLSAAQAMEKKADCLLFGARVNSLETQDKSLRDTLGGMKRKIAEAKSHPSQAPSLFEKTQEARMRWDMQERMMDARAAAVLLNGVDKVIEASARFVCDVHPSVHKVCSKTKEAVQGGVRKALEASGLKEPLQRALYSYFHRLHVSFPEELERQFGVPLGDAKQYGRDLSTVGLAAAAIPVGEVTGVVSKAGIKTLFSLTSQAWRKGGIGATSLQIAKAYTGRQIEKSLPSAALAIEGAVDEILERGVPLIETAGQATQEEIWKKAISQQTGLSPKDVALRYPSRDADVGDVVVKMGELVIKDKSDETMVLGELAGLNHLRSLGLDNLILPTPIAIGRYTWDFEGRAFIVKSHLPGDTLETLLEKVGAHPFSSAERFLEMDSLLMASEHLGRALGQLKRKSPHVAKEEASRFHLIDKPIAALEDKIDDLGVKLASRPLKKLIAQFQKNPGRPVYGFADSEPSQFVWSKVNRTSQLGLADAELIPTTFDVRKMPQGPSALDEFHSLRSQLGFYGVQNNLTHTEAMACQEAFQRGWFLEYQGELVPEAYRFYSVLYGLDAWYFFEGSKNPLQRGWMERAASEVSATLSSIKD